MLLGQLLQLDEGVVGLCLHLFLQLEPVFVHLGLELVLLGDELLLVLPPHSLVARHLLPQLVLLLVLVDLTGDLPENREKRQVRWERRVGGVRGVKRSETGWERGDRSAELSRMGPRSESES